ncbi:MAG: phenylalanine--tRNA ligase subunit alpha [Candidatus Omnitrophica bacterium]|nr:phenylalanine--tRNA ligase subunit alpha [Candidatus Omnitrophota bacterium]
MSHVQDLSELAQEARAALQGLTAEEAVEAFRVRYLGRKGLVTQRLKELGALPEEKRREAGRLLNVLKQELEEAIRKRQGDFRQGRAERPVSMDLTLPGILPARGRLHPLTQTIRRLEGIFISLGFEVVSGPEIETEYYNFEALNIPLDHPSREAFDTFYLDEKYLLRSQTSTVQIRVMESRKPPLAIVAPGRVFRPDATDATHSFMFHQVEGLLVGERITFADLKGTLELFCRRLFGPRLKFRFRPSFFPFTEPSAEVDISCFSCRQKGCRVCSGTGWLEILGAGMVDPNVFEAVGYDPEGVQGFAFGVGVERLAMLLYGVEDIRLFFENDLRFLRQF